MRAHGCFLVGVLASVSVASCGGPSSTTNPVTDAAAGTESGTDAQAAWDGPDSNTTDAGSIDSTTADAPGAEDGNADSAAPPADSATDAIACAVDAASFEAGAGDCVGDTPITAGGQSTGFSRCGTVGPVHRSQKMACPDLRMPAPPGSCTQSGAAYCQSSAGCTAVMHGVCVSQGSGFCKCVGACLSDSDCATGEICQCGASNGVCVSAKCTSDGDCGPGLLCATVPSSDGTSTFFACQTPQDQCFADPNCPACAKNCLYDTASSRRICSISPHGGNP